MQIFSEFSVRISRLNVEVQRRIIRHRLRQNETTNTTQTQLRPNFGMSNPEFSLILHNHVHFKSLLLCTNLIKLKKINSTTAFQLNLTRPLRRKLRMRWFFDVSKVKESSFFKSDLTDPPQIFDAYLLVNTDLSSYRFHFSGSLR